MASGAGGMRQQVLEAVDRYRMLQAGDKVLVAVSGGPDSVALLHVLRSLTRELGVELAAAHLNHELRGEQSDQDEAYVRELCANWDLPCFVAREDVAAWAKREGLSLEEAGREARYHLLTGLAAEHSFDRVALGHTASDRVETLLINILRGSGLHGLRGIPPVRGIFIRPLITTSRQDTVEYCCANSLLARCDESNLDPSDFLRNKIRLKLLPLLAEEYTEDPQQVLLRLIQAAEEELDWTEPLVEEAFIEIAEVGHDRVRLNRAKLAEMPAGLLHRVLRRALVELSGAATDVGTVHYDELRKLIQRGQTGAKLHLPGRLLATIGYTDFELVASGELPTRNEAAAEWSYELPMPGMVQVPESEMTVAAQLLAESSAEFGDAVGSPVVVDADAVDPPLQVRNWRPGDAIQPLGMSGHKKLQDLFVDEKVPRRQRSAVALVVDSRNRIIWAVGLRVGEPFRVTQDTSTFLRLSATPVEESCR